jgi:glycosyltransferase involved in cell wall biosynthesis
MRDSLPSQGQHSTKCDRISIIVSSLRGGGAERVAVNLARSFSDLGKTVYLVVVNRTGELEAQIPPAVNIVNLNRQRARSAVTPLRKHLKAVCPGTCIAIAPQINLLLALASLGLDQRPYLIFTVHNTHSISKLKHPFLKRMLLDQGYKALYGFADRIVAVSKGAAEDLVKSGIVRELPTVIYNPIFTGDVVKFAREAPDDPWVRDGSVPLIVTAGRLTADKNHNLLLRAFQSVLKRRKARLIVLGDGELRSLLERRAMELGVAGETRFLGFQSNPYSYMARAAVFALSSTAEGFGNVLVEAMAAGAPVVSTDCPYGPREILEQGRYGSLVALDDPEGLASAIIGVLDGGGIDGRVRAADFEAERIARQYLSLIDEPPLSPRFGSSSGLP